MGGSRKAFFLDRDGVLNKLVDGRPPWNLPELIICSYAHDLVSAIKAKNYIPVIVTNQPDAARGAASRFELLRIRERLRKELKIDYYYACYHGYDGCCLCRKPQPGMLLNAATALNISLRDSFMVGDRQKDILAGLNAGCRTILFNSSEKSFARELVSKADHHYSDYNQLRQFIDSLG